MSFPNYNLKVNPFRTVPGIQSDELVWAGFSDVKAKFEGRIKRSIKLRNSGIVLNWGEYGSGKTHAAKFFGKKSELDRLAAEASGITPFHIYLTLPKGKAPVEDLFTSVIDKLDLTHIRTSTAAIKEDIINYVEQTFSDSFIRACIKAVFIESEDTEQSLIKRFLYGNVTPKEIRGLEGSGILRKFKSEDDYIRFIAALFSTLTYEKCIYSCVILWIDEFEDIVTLNNSSLEKINSSLRDLFDNTPNNLLIFLNLTQSSLFTAEDLGQYISESVKSRIRDRINFDLPDRQAIIDYLTELLKQFRIDEVPDQSSLFPFEEGVVNQILIDFKNASVRKYNEIFSTLLEIGDLEEVLIIDLPLYEANKSEIVGFQ
ncbi:hypothetical protein [Spirosoma pomorum]